MRILQIRVCSHSCNFVFVAERSGTNPRSQSRNTARSMPARLTPLPSRTPNGSLFTPVRSIPVHADAVLPGNDVLYEPPFPWKVSQIKQGTKARLFVPFMYQPHICSLCQNKEIILLALCWQTKVYISVARSWHFSRTLLTKGAANTRAVSTCTAWSLSG